MRLATSVLVALLLLAAGPPAAVSAAPAVEPKVAIVVGPVGTITDRYRALADEAAAAAAKYTSRVVKIYSPDATWPAVREALQGASIVIYLGHGNGFPSKYSTALKPATQNGFGLNPVAGDGDSGHQYFGEGRIATEIKLAKNAVVLLNHLCYASGNTEPGLPEGTIDQAQVRIDNFAAGFIQAGASAVVAEAHMGPAWYVRSLLTSHRTVDRIWRSSPSAKGHESRFESARSPGFVAAMDPDQTGSGFYRSIVYRGGVGAGQVVAGGATAIATPSLPSTPSLIGRGVTLGMPYPKQRPLAGSTGEFWIPYTAPSGAALDGLMVGIRWDPIDVPAVPADQQAAAGEGAASGEGTAAGEAATGEEAAAPATEPQAPTVVVPRGKPASGGAADGPAADAAASPAPSPVPSPAAPSASPALDTTGVQPEPATEPSVSDPSEGRVSLIEPEQLGTVVEPIAAAVGPSRIHAVVAYPDRPGRYRLVATLHDRAGVAFDAASQSLMPGLLVRVPGTYSAAYLVAPTATATADGAFEIRAAVANVGEKIWGRVANANGRGREGDSPTSAFIVAHWVNLTPGAGDTGTLPEMRVRLPAGFGGGGTARVTLRGTAPAAAGDYLLVIDVLVPGVGSLAAQGAEPALVRVKVTLPA